MLKQTVKGAFDYWVTCPNITSGLDNADNEKM